MGTAISRFGVVRNVLIGIPLALATTSASAAVVATLGFESAPTNAISALAGGGDIGFSGSSTNTGAATFGASDVTPQVLATAVGATQFQAANTGKVGTKYYGWAPHISSGALTNRTDTLTLDPVTFTAGSTNRSASFNLLLDATTYEVANATDTQDFIKITLTVDGTPTTLFDSTTALPNSGDLDGATVAANGFAPDGAYHTLTYTIPNGAGSVVLKIQSAFNSSAGAEGMAVDNFVFSQTPAPEPATMGLAAVAGVGLLARRRRA